MFPEIQDPVIFNRDAFTFKQLLHEAFMAKVVFPRQYAVAVYDPVCR